MYQVITEHFAFRTPDGRFHSYTKGDLIVEHPYLAVYEVTGYLEKVGESSDGNHAAQEVPQ